MYAKICVVTVKRQLFGQIVFLIGGFGCLKDKRNMLKFYYLILFYGKIEK